MECLTESNAGANSAMPPKLLPKAITDQRWSLSLVIPSFVENSGHLLRLYERAESGGKVRTRMKTSKLEEEALRQLLAAGLPEPEREYQFLPDRKFRWDFAWVREKIALEVNGGTWVVGGHSSGAGIARDYEKMNLAQLAGWTVLQVTGQDVKRGAVADLVKKAM